MIKEIVQDKELKEKIQLANTSDEELVKLNYKDKQKVYKAKNGLCRVFHRGGTYVKRER